jgi:hypothetical protein
MSIPLGSLAAGEASIAKPSATADPPRESTLCVMADSNFVIFGISRSSICNDFCEGREYHFDNRIH